MNYQDKFLIELFIQLRDNPTNNRNNRAAMQCLRINLPRNRKNKLNLFSLGYIAIKNDCVKVIKFLIEFGMDVNTINGSGNTLLHLCAMSCFRQSKNTIKNIITELLLKNGANPNIKNNFGSTPLHILCNKHFIKVPKMLKLLIQYHADVNAEDVDKRTPLFYSAEINVLSVSKFLIENNADINYVDLNGINPLLACIIFSFNQFQVFKLLMDNGANIHQITNQHQSLLHLLVENNITEFLQRIIDMNININTVNKYGQTALHLAASNMFVDIVKCLLENNIDINILDKSNRPALHNICFHLNPNSIRYFRISNLYNSQEVMDLRRDRMNTTKTIVKMLKEHIIKIKCAGFYVNNENLYYIYGENDNFSDEDEDEDENEDSDLKVQPDLFQNFCLEEIKTLKANIGDNNVTFLDILTADLDTVTMYAQNDSILPILSLKNNDKKFPLYIDMIRNRFAQGLRRHKILKIAEACFISSISDILPSICIGKILRFLDSYSLMKFVKILRPTDRFDF